MKIIIPGDPIAQIRMKYSGRHGIGRIYDPREKQKKQIKAFIAGKFGDHPRFDHPRVSFVFHMAIPKSIPKKLLHLYQSGFLKHEKKPDTDNFLKLYLDCMDNICFDGDQKVSLGDCVKLYHLHPKTIIIINETQELISPLELDPMTWFALYGKECGKCSSSEMDALPDFYTPNRLESSQSAHSPYPSQIIQTCETIPVVPRILVPESRVSSPRHCQL